MGQQVRRAITVLGILSVTDCGGGNSAPAPPSAVESADVMQGAAPLTVNFDASGSSDPQGRSLSYTWAFGDSSASGTGATVTHTFNNHGTYSASVVVNNGSTSSAKSLTIAVSPAAPTIQPLSFAVNVLGVAPTVQSVQLAASDRENLTLTYALVGAPAVGSATIDSSTGLITYTVPGLISAASSSFTVQASNLGAAAQSAVNITLNTDPLLQNQWHIQNTGQDAFASTLPVSGNDMNVAGA